MTDLILIATLAGFGAFLATSSGALPALLCGSLGPRVQNALLGFAAGVMLAASFFSLLLPALEAAEAIYASRTAAALIAALALLFGAALMRGLDLWVPHEHFVQGREGPRAESLRRIWLLIFAITLHNLPEGLAIGVAFGGGDLTAGLAVAIGIGIQDIPEGMAVALSLAALGYRRGFAALVTALTGAVEPLGAFVGIAVVTLAAPLLPWGLAFAAGAMLYVISHEIIPETHRRGFQDAGTLGLMIGLAVMMVLDVTLG